MTGKPAWMSPPPWWHGRQHGGGRAKREFPAVVVPAVASEDERASAAVGSCERAVAVRAKRTGGGSRSGTEGGTTT
ncbi:hypothetical protein Q31b_19640 [Novipirellula aureliae]|uniref:Uncharacterized protein n=1 Tax=Novipirellula aureliae TaxID=2527966 RepID=A0A5C6E5N5_9BACT|nr:hypothetical protein [Novipirellula aureliae]TWU42931.1 hypothetical protein Q31b_19640 [Novipirellula aureliae]